MMMLAKWVNRTLAVALLSLSVSAFLLTSAMNQANQAYYASWELICWGESVSFPLLIDSYSSGFVFTVSAIAGSIYAFSLGYMSAEKFFLRFHLLVLSFVASMMLLILSPNLVSVFLGWDGLGVTSYLLVVYFQSSKSYNAGLLTALTNRLGDVLILLAGALMFWLSWNFGLWASGEAWGQIGAVWLVVLAACTKSAQVPFSAWLPAAMAAPTPVSALVHSSTLVTAGIYLVFRFCPALVSHAALFYLFVVGALTMFMAGCAAMVESDMKKIIALSTLSQLGVMMMTLGAGHFVASFLHLISHAFFKALLFMTIGAMIHMSNDYQDLRKVSLLSPRSVLTLSFSLLANLSLCGIPFTSGFFSKDLCIELVASFSSNMAMAGIFYLATGLTAAYTVRLISLAVVPYIKSPTLKWTHDYDFGMNSGMLILSPLAVMGGALLMWWFSPEPLILPLPWAVKNLTLGVILTGSIGGALLAFNSSRSYLPGAWTFGLMYGLPRLSARCHVESALTSAHRARHGLDLTWTPTILISPSQATWKASSVSPQGVSQAPWVLAAGGVLAISLSIWVYLCVPNFFSF